MPNGIKYVLMTLFFVILTKILQVVAFDSKHYEKLQRESESSGYSVYSVTAKKNKKEANRSKDPKEVSDKGAEEKHNEIAKNAQLKKRLAKEETASKASNAYAHITLSSLKNNYLAPLLSKIPEDHLREDIVIRYYRHKKDLEKVDKLKSLSYYIHEKQAVETAGLGSNIIYYGDDVPLEDIQIVAFTLLEEGIPLKSIKHTKFEWKAKAIEIGTDTTLLNDPNISIEEIQDFHKQYVNK